MITTYSRCNTKNICIVHGMSIYNACKKHRGNPRLSAPAMAPFLIPRLYLYNRLGRCSFASLKTSPRFGNDVVQTTPYENLQLSATCHRSTPMIWKGLCYDDTKSESGGINIQLTERCGHLELVALRPDPMGVVTHHQLWARPDGQIPSVFVVLPYIT